MANKHLIKRSSVVGRAPLAGDLDFGELALNFADGKLYFKDANGDVQFFTTDTGGGGGTGASVTISTTPPSSPSATDLWWNSEDATLYIYYTDADGSQWVSAAQAGGGSAGSSGSATIADGSITSDKLADNAVIASKITDGSVTSAKLAATAITDKLGYTPADTNTISEFYSASPSSFTFNYSIDNPNAYSTPDNDVFGGSMAISGNIAAISARLEDDAGGTNSGVVYVYNLATNTLLQTISNPNAYGTSQDDYFGNTVALDGNILAVAALGEDDANGLYTGKVYIFNTSTGSLLHTLDDPYIAGLSSAYDNFGLGLAVSGNYIFVGVPSKDYDVSTADSGKVYVYSAVSGLLLYSIDNPNAYGTRTGDRFGYVIASYGSYIAVNAFDEDDANNTSSGKVYVFSVGSSSATLLYTLNNPNPVITATADNFGRALAISSTKLVVGSREQSGVDTASGYAFIYDLATGTLLHSIANPNAYATPSNDQFGESLGISGDLLIAGARGESDPTSSSYVGKAYVFDMTTGSLLLTIDDPNKYSYTHADTFGNAIAASGSHVLISATGEGTVTGSGVVYKYTAISATSEVSVHTVTATELSVNNITISGNITPTTNEQQDLGTPTLRFRDLYLSGSTIDLAGALISTDPANGTIALLGSPTESNPNPSALVISSSGQTAVVETTGGVVDFAVIQNELDTGAAFSVDTATIPLDGQVLTWSDTLGQWTPGGLVAPVISGPTTANELATGTYTILNYDANLAYVITVSGGTYTRSGDTIYWTYPSVSSDTVHYLTALSASGGATSGLQTVNVTVQDITVADTAIIVGDFSATSLNGWY